jgi:hypothetical protein
VFAVVLLGLNLVLVAGLVVVLDRGRLLSPASARLREEELARKRAVAQRRARLATLSGD